MIIPAKTLDSAKSRLPLPDGERRALALRLAASTIRVALQTSGVGLVLVVNSDSQIARTSQTAGATVVDESRPRGLNAAVRLGQREARRRRPTCPVATLVTDLPRLRTADLEAALEEYWSLGRPMAVADSHGTGTTMLIQGPEDDLLPQFGENSAHAHQRCGFHLTSEPLRGLREDFDDEDDLLRAVGAPGVNSLRS